MTTSLLIISRFLQYSAGMTLAGVVAFRWLFLLPVFARESDMAWERFAPLLAWLERVLICAGLVLVLSGAGLFWATAASMSDTPLWASLSSVTLGTVLFQTQFGAVFEWRMGLILTLAAFLLRLQWTRQMSRRSYAISELGAGLVAGALLVSLAGTGHAAAVTGPWLIARVMADAVHLLITAIWPAGLLPFALLLAYADRVEDVYLLGPLRTLVHRFSQVSLAIVFLLVGTGVVNTCCIAGSFAALTNSTYGSVLAVKLLILLAVLVVATVNRFGVVPRLETIPPRDAAHVLRRLRQLVVWELALALGIIAAVSVLGITAPPG